MRKLFCILLSMSAFIQAETLYLGSIGDDPQEEIQEFHSLALYLKAHLHESGVDEVKTVVASSNKKMAKLIAQQKVHLYIDSPFPSILVSKEAGSTIFLRRWKKGKEKYRSVIFSRIDSNIHSIEDMQGQMMAFEDPFSTSSYFLPKSTLALQGVRLLELGEAGEVPKDKTGYLFSDDDRNTMLWVLRKKVPIGAMNESSYYKLAKKRVKDLHIITHSIWVPRHVVSYGPGMSVERVQLIREVLASMHESDEGKAALLAFSKTSKFDEFPGGAEKHLAPLNQLLQFQ